MSGNPTFACIRFMDAKTESFCVPIDFIKIKNSQKKLISFNPKDESDFHKHNIYFVKWQCANNCNDDHEHDGYYKAQIGFLAENEAVAKKRMKDERIRYASQKADVTSSDYNEDSSSDVQELCRRKIRKTDTVKRNVAITIAQEVLQSYKKSSFLNERPKINDNSITSFANQRNIPNISTNVPNDVLHKDINVEDNVGDKNEDNDDKNGDDVENRNQKDVVDDDSDNISTICDNGRIGQRSKKIQHVKRRLFNRNILKSSSDSDNASTSNENFRCSFEEENNTRYSEQNIDDNEDNDVSCEGQSVSQKLNNKLLKRKRIKDALDYVDAYNTHKRYETISNKRTYLGENISVDLLSWQMTKMQRKPSLFFNDVLVYIWLPNILKNRCLDQSRTRYKSSSGPVEVLSPRKLSLALSLYNDYLIELKMKDDTRFKYLNDSFKIICTKIRDVRIKYKDQSEKEANERRIETSN